MWNKQKAPVAEVTLLGSRQIFGFVTLSQEPGGIIEVRRMHLGPAQEQLVAAGGKRRRPGVVSGMKMPEQSLGHTRQRRVECVV
jgi:hypothetical protein